MNGESLAEDIICRREELAALIQRHASSCGEHETAIGPVTPPTVPIHPCTSLDSAWSHKAEKRYSCTMSAHSRYKTMPA